MLSSSSSRRWRWSSSRRRRRSAGGDWGRMASAIAIISLSLLITGIHTATVEEEEEEDEGPRPNRIWSERCSQSDIVISQGTSAPLPNGIPTYRVEIINVCTSSPTSACHIISSIHVSCGWFSSARLVNPRIFRRLRFNDCLVNDGNPLPIGRSLSFQYANTYPYPLSVTSLKC